MSNPGRSAISTIRAITFALLSVAISTHTAAQSSRSLAELSVQLAAGEPLPLGNAVSMSLLTTQPQNLASAFADRANVQVTEVGEGQVGLILTEPTSITDEPKAAHLADTFVIDIGEPSTQAFIEGYGFTQSAATRSTAASPLAMQAYVSEYMQHPTTIHGFNIASVVARERSGDCTEYAVLTTALARAQGVPARLMIGVVLVEYTHGVQAVGHAWTEVWRESQLSGQAGHWQVIDAALHGDNSGQRLYLPIGALKNESAGYGLGLLGLMSLMPRAVVELQGEAAATQ